jgi:hypothetical protein
VNEPAALFARRAELLRELAAVDEALAVTFCDTQKPLPPVEDRGLTLPEAARLFGEPPETFRTRLEYRKALISKPGQHRLRYSRAELERIKADMLAANRATYR